MNRIHKKVEIAETDIEEMCLLAEDVMHALYSSYADYDTEGNDIFAKYYNTKGDFKKDILPLIHAEIRALCEDPNSELLYALFRRGDDIGEVRYYTSEDVIPWIEPIIPKALKIFRKGTNANGETDFVAKESVPDDYLIAVFAREVRNMMMIFAGQKLQREGARHYLLLLAVPSCHDGDEWLGIYYDDENLRKAYDSAIAELEEKKKNDRNDCSFNVEIWEFKTLNESDITMRDGKPEMNYGRCIINEKQLIRPVKLEELQCMTGSEK